LAKRKPSKRKKVAAEQSSKSVDAQQSVPLDDASRVSGDLMKELGESRRLIEHVTISM
jgi:hypothetical protein